MSDSAPATPASSDTTADGLIVVEPVRVDSRRILVALTSMWLLGLIVLAALWSWLGAHGHRSWFWTALDGTILGVLGIVLAGRHREAGRTD